MLRRLQGKVAIITGTAGGTGRAAAELFAAEGAHVVGCDLDPEGAAETVARVREAGHTMDSVAPLDLSEPGSGERLIDAAVGEHGRIDVLYNNAAGIRVRPYAEASIEDWRWTIQNELDLFHFVTSAAWPHLVESSGTVLNAASLNSVRGAGTGEFTLHGVAKGGVLALTYHLAAAGAPHGIRVNAVIPGAVRSPSLLAVQASGVAGGGSEDDLARSIPLGRLCSPEDVARAALFLVSDEASYITGVALPVDGGASRILL